MAKSIHLLLTCIVLLIFGVMLDIGCTKVERPKVLKGWINKADLFEAAPSYQEDYKKYEPNPKAVEIIAAFPKRLQVIVFLGTWCPDCAREAPKFIKTLENAGNSRITLKMLALDRSKKDGDGVTEQYRIERIPTFVFLVDGTEIGRLVEKVEMSIEEDMATLLVDVM